MNIKQRRIFGVIFSVAFFLLAGQAGFSQSGKELAITAARAYETAPLDKSTADLRSKALKWVIETDEVSIVACGEIFTLFSDKKNKNSSDMTGAYMLGMAAFKLENPDKSGDENAVQQAGLGTALKAYEGIVKEKPKTKNDAIETLLTRRNNGELATIVAASNCKKK
ncbi:MAG TPA: hypothetical protein VK612_12440 [Pyrinomonadaceae bacterium]|nr:hypothetical protein [Pyrinomonadaceae bacterium]